MTADIWRRMVSEHKHKKTLANLRKQLKIMQNLLKYEKDITYERRVILESAIHNLQMDIDKLTGEMPKWFWE